MASSSRIASLLALGVAAFGLAVGQPSLVRAHDGDRPKTGPDSGGEEILPPAAGYEAGDVKVDEKLGAQLPLDAVFRTHTGATTTLGQVLRGGLPVILTFNYSDCPMLCSLQLNGLTAALPKVGERGASPDPTATGQVMFRPGAQYRIVTIDLEPSETLEKAQAMRRRYLERFPEDQRKDAEAGWTFLTAAIPGDGAAIRRVAEAVGFRYTFVKDRAEWAHPAALIFLSAGGAVTRYLYGIEFDPKIMRESIYKAGLAEPAAAVGFMIRCYHYDPGANSHARAGVSALRVGAAGFAILMFSALGVMHYKRRHRLLPAAPNGVT